HYFIGQPASCVVNPRAGRETKLVYAPAAKRQRVAVVGAGPAGLSCAAVAAERGHEVVLFEKAGELGGQFNLAKRIPGKQEFAESIAYYAERLRRAGAKVVLGHAPGESELAQFDEVVLATGIDPRRPQIPGIEHRRVVGYTDAIAGRAPIGRSVAIIGAGGIAFDVALYLLERNGRSQLDPEVFDRHWGVDRSPGAPGGLDPRGPAKPHAGHRITMLKRSQTPFGHTLGRSTGWVHRLELQKNGVAMMKGVEYRRIDDIGLHIALDGAESIIPADSIIVCAGQEPKRDLVPALKQLGRAPHLIGGANLATELDAKRAMLEGADLAARL
ncbi:MAG: FAD-dependent oxidoreductase, partial [Burkholderiales bacterium]